MAYSEENSIFVASDGCNEKGDGSIDRPYQTLDCAQALVKPGQTVYFREGVYNIELNDLGVIYSKGTPDAWITFTNYNGEKVVFDGCGRGMLISSFKNLITFYKAEYIIFDGFEVRNIWGAGIRCFDAFHITVRNCKAHGFHGAGIGGNGQFLLYEYNEVYNNCLSNENHATYRGKGSGWASALATHNRPNFMPSTNVIMRYNKVYENWGEGINAFNASNVVMVGNEARDNYSINMYCDTSSNVTMEDNLVISNNPDFYRDDSKQPAAGIQFSNEGTQTTARVKPYNCAEHIIIRNNTIEGVSDGITYWEDKKNTWASNTYRNIVISGNTFKDITLKDIHINKVSMPNVDPPRDCELSNNMFSVPGGNMFVGDPQAWVVFGNN